MAFYRWWVIIAMGYDRVDCKRNGTAEIWSWEGALGTDERHDGTLGWHRWQVGEYGKRPAKDRSMRGVVWRGEAIYPNVYSFSPWCSRTTQVHETRRCRLSDKVGHVGKWTHAGPVDELPLHCPPLSFLMDVQMDAVDLAPQKVDLVSMCTMDKSNPIHRFLVLLFV